MDKPYGTPGFELARMERLRRTEEEVAILRAYLGELHTRLRAIRPATFLAVDAYETFRRKRLSKDVGPSSPCGEMLRVAGTPYSCARAHGHDGDHACTVEVASYDYVIAEW